MVNQIFQSIMSNFSFSMLILAIIVSVFHSLKAHKKLIDSETWFKCLVMIAYGFTCLYIFILNLFLSGPICSVMGYHQSPFQIEAGLTNLALGVIAILAFRKERAMKKAALISAILYWWGAVIIFGYKLEATTNFELGFPTSWLWTNIFVPLLMLIFYIDSAKSASVIKETLDSIRSKMKLLKNKALRKFKKM